MKNNQLTVVDLANELKRLALSAARDVRNDSDLACLSNLTALNAVSKLLFETLAGGLTFENGENQEQVPQKAPIGFHSVLPQKG